MFNPGNMVKVTGPNGHSWIGETVEVVSHNANSMDVVVKNYKGVQTYISEIWLTLVSSAASVLTVAFFNVGDIVKVIGPQGNFLVGYTVTVIQANHRADSYQVERLADCARDVFCGMYLQAAVMPISPHVPTPQPTSPRLIAYKASPTGIFSASVAVPGRLQHDDVTDDMSRLRPNLLAPGCECGADSVKSLMHSSWCPKHFA